MHLVCYLMHYIFGGPFSYSYALSVTVLTLWMAPPKMFYNIIVLDLMKPKQIVELHRFWASYCGTVVTFLSKKNLPSVLASLKKLFRLISKVCQLEIYIISLLNLFKPCNVHEDFSMGLLAFSCTKHK